MTIKYYPELVQGSDEWFAARRGLLTGSEMKLVVSRKTNKKTGEVTYKSPDEDKTVAHLYELAAQRISGYVEPTYIGDDMLRGHAEEIDARTAYDKTYTKLETMGFVTNDKWGFTLGYSPDALTECGAGQIECKSRRQKFQIETIANDEVPSEYMIQIQTGMLVSGRKWCDFISYCGGLPMFVKRVEANAEIQAAILEAATTFHEKLELIIIRYKDQAGRFIPTERKIIEEMI